jgi:hypothetical protein
METSKWPTTGIYLAAITPLAPFPCASDAPQIFRVKFDMPVSNDQQMTLYVEVSAHSPNQAAQEAYAKASVILGELSKVAQDASDYLRGKAGN